MTTIEPHGDHDVNRPRFVLAAMSFAVMATLAAPFLRSAAPEPPVPAQCQNAFTGLPALQDPAGGGLYGFGSNARPHDAEVLAAAALITPRAPNGTPTTAPNGRIGFVGMGLSNGEMAFAAFRLEYQAHPQRNPKVVFANAAWNTYPANTLDVAANPAGPYWTSTVPQRVASAGLTPLQVQAVVVHEGVIDETIGTTQQVALWRTFAVNVLAKFPNCKLFVAMPLGYMGFATKPPHEPHAHDQGYAVRDLCLAQAAGDPDLEIGVDVPAILWGPNVWTDGTRGRADGMVWWCTDAPAPDVLGDGRHPSRAGAYKISSLLIGFTMADSAMTWARVP